MPQTFYFFSRWCIPLVTISWLSSPALANSDFVAIADLNLRQCVHQTAAKHNWQQPQDFSSLKCHNKNITRLDGIEKFINIETLSLHKNAIKAADVSALTKLQRLNLARNNIETLNVAKLPQLTELYIFGNPLTQLQLSHLPKLQKLKASGNRLLQFEYTDLPALEKIYMFNNELEHIDIHNLPSLTYMDVRQNPMPDPLYEEMDKQKRATILHDGNADDWD